MKLLSITKKEFKVLNLIINGLPSKLTENEEVNNLIISRLF